MYRSSEPKAWDDSMRMDPYESIDAGPAPEQSKDFCARVSNVIDWESISGPAARRAVPMLLELESEQRCDPWLWRPLHYAAIYGVVEAIEVLTSVGANINAQTGGHAQSGRQMSKATFNFASELEYCGKGRQESAKAIEVNGDFVAIMRPGVRKTAVPIQDCMCVGYSSGQQPNHVRRFTSATPLHIAIEYQHIGAIRALLERAADPNTSWNEGRDMPLHTAIWQGFDDAVEALLFYKADPNFEDCWGRFPLAAAAVCPKNPSRRVATLLLDAGARQGATDRSGKTASHLAREIGNNEFADAVEMYDIYEVQDRLAKEREEDDRRRWELQEKLRKEAEARQKREAEEKAKREAEERARREAEEKVRREAEE